MLGVHYAHSRARVRDKRRRRLTCEAARRAEGRILNEHAECVVRGYSVECAGVEDEGDVLCRQARGERVKERRRTVCLLVWTMLEKADCTCMGVGSPNTFAVDAVN